jgi:hypothetical protein
VEILFDTPRLGATRIQTCNISSADRVALLQDAIGALAEAVAMLGGTVNIADLAGVKRCARCGRMFRGLRSDARYCSLACRQGAYRDRCKDPGRAPSGRPRLQSASAQQPARPRTPAVVRHWFV